MPRMGRVVVPQYPHHIIQCGHDRNVVFASESDFRYYLDTLTEFKELCGVYVYAYCLMTNHVHLLLAPSDRRGLGLLMKRLAGRQTHYRNKLEGRSGTLWESRYKSSLIDANQYLLACVRYIELNPVRAGMVVEPGEYAWSSYRARICKTHCSWLDPIPGFETILTGEEQGAEAYEAYNKSIIPNGEWDLIRSAVTRGQLTGGERFGEEIQQITGRRIKHRGRGRPLKQRK